MLTHTLRIDWSELDLLGHVNNVSFYKYIQSARVNLWEHIGLDVTLQQNQTGLMLASCSCEFKKPLFYPGSVRIETRVTHIGTTSYQTEHRLFDDQNELSAIGRDAMVFYDFEQDAKIAVPEKVKTALEKLN